ncbi:hypothetical protein PsorP6_009333 [Peronosclerospora sorghi]|uniref:Uncharacterized protein n=1 Tax=Peronosclerospora sorghi TaxID=230839 RepID=A0ACC0W2N1_9STRA|nr:hypothetical protein PsorP6_009333 [Peronosclerospora sorghi]
MDDTDAEELRVEVVVVDYYMSKPLPLNAIEKLPPSPCYARAHAVPVVRIFGATPAGQKTLVHIHGIFPYFYFRAETHAAFDDPERLRSFLPQLAKEIEAAHDSNQPQRQKDKATWSCGKLIAKMLIVQGTPFYGYHATSKLFVQIFLYDPLAVKAVVHVLESGCLGGVRFQPYEAHVPFLLQVFADYNIEGMNYVAFSNVHFRAPLPVVQDHLVHDESGQYHVRLSSTVPAHRIHGVKIQTTSWTGRYVAVPRVSTQWYDRHSTCALEADVAGACILNPQRFESMQRKAAMDGEVRHVPALAAIWEEERGRRSRRGERATPTMSCSLSRQEVAPARASRNRSPTHDATSSSLLSQSFFQHTMEQAVAAVMKNVEAQATRAAASALTPAVWDVSCGKSIAAASAYSYSQAEHASTDTREGGEDGRGRGDGTSTESDCFRPPTAEEDEAIVNLLLAMQRDTSRAEAGTTARARGHDARAGYESVDEASDDGGDDAHTDTDAHDEIHNILASQRLVEDQRLRERRGLPGQEKVWGPLASPGRERDNCRAILPPRQAHAHTVETTPCASCCASSPRSDSIVQTRARAGSREDVPLVGDIEDLLPPRPQALVHVSRTRSDASEPMQGAPLSRTPHPPPPKESRATVAPVPSLAAASNTGDKTRWWRFRPDPPSYTQLLSSSHAVGVTRIQYQAAFYSKAADIPPKPLVFGGKKYRFTPQDRRHLPTFDTTATRARLNALETSRPSSSWGKLAQCQTASIGREGEEKVRPCFHSVLSFYGQSELLTRSHVLLATTMVDARTLAARRDGCPRVCRRKRARSSVVLTPTSPSTPRSAPTTRSNLTILSVEVFAPSRGTMLPHPLHDPVTAICYAIEAQEGPVPDQTHERGVLLVQRDDDVAPNAATLQSEGLWRDHDEDNVSVLVVADERALLHAFEDVVRRWDPDFLVGFEVQKASIGYLVDRAAQMDMNLIQSLSRLPSTPIDRRNATPTSEHVRDSQHDDASIGTTWGMHKAAGLWMHGRHVLNLWRLTRSEVPCVFLTTR